MATDILGLSNYINGSNQNEINNLLDQGDDDVKYRRIPEEFAIKRKIEEITDVISSLNVSTEDFEVIRKRSKNRKHVISYEPIDVKVYLKRFVTTQLIPVILVILTGIWQVCLFGLVVLLWIWEALIYPHKDEIIEKILFVCLVVASWIWELLNAPLYLECTISKNECICSGAQKRPNYSQDTDATLTVEEWRLHSVQSPIELKHEESNEYDHFEPLVFHGHWDDEGESTIINNGYTATITFQDRSLPHLVGGPLHNDKFIFEQLHFHWSDDDHSGCEHIFEGKAYSMEAHAVHYNSKYESFKEAVAQHDGLAVVAFFLQATDDFENECFKKLSEAVKDIVKIDTTTKVKADCLSWIKNAAQCKGYYTYQGSLTTQPYNESVTWIIYPKPIHVSREQVKNFRSMNSTPCGQYNIDNNVRPIQIPNKKLDIFYARSHRANTVF